MLIYKQIEENFYIPKLQRKVILRRLYPTIEFLMNNRREALLTISRGVYLGYFSFHCFLYCLPPFTYIDEQLFYLKALAANAVTGIIMLYYKVARMKEWHNKKFFTTLVYEDNGLQMLLFSLIFMCDFYLFNNTMKYCSVYLLFPVAISTLLYFSGSTIRILNLLDLRENPLHSLLNAIVGRNALYILQYADFLEMSMFPVVIAMCRSNKYAIFAAASYFIYLYLRFKNTYCSVRSLTYRLTAQLRRIRQHLHVHWRFLCAMYRIGQDEFRAVFYG